MNLKKIKVDFDSNDWEEQLFLESPHRVSILKLITEHSVFSTEHPKAAKSFKEVKELLERDVIVEMKDERPKKNG